MGMYGLTYSICPSRGEAENECIHICGNQGLLYIACGRLIAFNFLTLTVLVTTIDAQWEGMGDVGSARYEPALLPPCPTIRVLSNSNYSANISNVSRMLLKC